jgi:cell division protein FtsB
MRALALFLGVLLVAIQVPLWFGKGGWLRVSELERQLASQRETNAGLAARNAQVAAEVNSLREGREAIEERARRELQMVRQGEVFFQVLVPKPDGAADSTPEK